jgi:hypothetical protein
MLVGALDGRSPALIRTWASTLQCRWVFLRQIEMRRRVLLAVTGATGSAVSTCCPLIASPSALIGFWMAANADHPAGPVVRRSFIMHHCFAVIWRRSLELNLCRIKFTKNQGVALWQRRRRRVRRRNRRAREVRLEHREIFIRQAAGPEFGRFRLAAAKSKEDALLLTVRSQY